MRRSIAFFMAILLLAFPIVASAASTRIAGVQPRIVFDGTTAKCMATIAGANANQHLEATIKFWHKNRCLQTWTMEGYEVLYFTEIVEVTRGNTYRLSVDLAIAGDMQPTVSVS